MNTFDALRRSGFQTVTLEMGARAGYFARKMRVGYHDEHSRPGMKPCCLQETSKPPPIWHSGRLGYHQTSDATSRLLFGLALLRLYCKFWTGEKQVTYNVHLLPDTT